ncbi:hypothetical protein F4811DRAFT_542767 [Daldinia bambusicola]|nr:hypothetical protein F4811DRAFT_542767 [Daldinia bambusicola]
MGVYINFIGTGAYIGSGTAEKGLWTRIEYYLQYALKASQRKIVGKTVHEDRIARGDRPNFRILAAADNDSNTRPYIIILEALFTVYLNTLPVDQVIPTFHTPQTSLTLYMHLRNEVTNLPSLGGGLNRAWQLSQGYAKTRAGAKETWKCDNCNKEFSPPKRQPTLPEEQESSRVCYKCSKLLRGKVNNDEWETDGTEDIVDVDLDEDGNVLKYPSNYAQKDSPQDKNKEKENILLAHFDGLSESMKSVALVFISQLNDMHQKTANSITTTRPPITMDDCRSSLISIQFNIYWTEKDERDLLGSWKSDPLAAELAKLDVRKNKDVLPLWKLVRRFLGCFPTEIICAQNSLRYSGNFTDSKGNLMEDPNWSKTFCRRLKGLVLHGLFQLDQSLLVLALQYVVICRTDYRGPILWTNKTTDCFIETFLANMQLQDGSLSVVSIHRSTLNDFARQGKQPIGYLSELFRRIEKRAFRERDDVSPVPDSPRIFELTSTDLAIVTRAANATKMGGIRPFLPPSVVSRIVLASKKSYDAPKTLTELNELRSSIILQEKRDIIMQKRKVSSGTDTPTTATTTEAS